jgi:MFS family permease
MTVTIATFMELLDTSIANVSPTLGGWITDNSSWRWIFFINIPVGMLSPCSR